MKDNSTIIEANNLKRDFKHTHAVDIARLDIQKGELFGVLGPDGAGKTTLLRMMAGILNPSAGALTVSGFDIVDGAESVKAIMGYMPQHFGLYSDLTVEENLFFAAEVYDVTGETRRKKIAELYEFTQLEPFKSRHAEFLSGGMKKKLALACAMIHSPALLLLDEPTTGVDPVARREFWDLLSGLHADGTTTVVSTPYMDEAERCNRVALLYHGHLLACDTPQHVKTMVPGRVLALQSSDLRTAQQILESAPYMLDIQTYGDQLNLIVNGDLDAARQHIKDQLSAQKIEINRLEQVPVRMEEAFIYLINQQERAA